MSTDRPNVAKRRKQHAALASRILAAGASTSALFGIVNSMASADMNAAADASPSSTTVPAPAPTVLVIREIHRQVMVDPTALPAGADPSVAFQPADGVTAPPVGDGSQPVRSATPSAGGSVGSGRVASAIPIPTPTAGAAAGATPSVGGASPAPVTRSAPSASPNPVAAPAAPPVTAAPTPPPTAAPTTQPPPPACSGTKCP